jgi:hypothetical protein
MQGMWDNRSRLLEDLVQVVADAQPDVFFFENVPGAAKNESFDFIRQRLGSSYIIRHLILSASELGFPHKRSRFFCIGVKAGFDARLLPVGGGAERLRLRPKLEPPRGVRAKQPGFVRRWHALGNAVVPACSYYALLHLLGVGHADCCALRKPWAGPPLELDPAAYTPPAGLRPRELTSPAVNAPFTLRLWPTPRAGNCGANHTLSERTTRDLCTAVRFEKSTPAGLRRWVNWRWTRWLMGYPETWAC